jgi:hypothetical protein
MKASTRGGAGVSVARLWCWAGRAPSTRKISSACARDVLRLSVSGSLEDTGEDSSILRLSAVFERFGVSLAGGASSLTAGGGSLMVGGGVTIGISGVVPFWFGWLG